MSGGRLFLASHFRARRQLCAPTLGARFAWRAAVVAVALTGIAWNPTTAQLNQSRIGIVQELRLDANAEDFPPVDRIYVGPRGEIVVPLPMDLQLHVYGPDGRRLATMGGRGSGPGELLSIGPAGWLADSLWVADPRQARTIIFDREFRVLRTETWPWGGQLAGARGGAIESFVPLSRLRGDVMLGAARWAHVGERGRESERFEGLVLREANGTARPLFARAPPSDEPWTVRIPDCCSFLVPFARPPQMVVAPDGERVAEFVTPSPASAQGRYTITLVRVPGDTIFSRSYAYRAEPIPSRALDSALARTGPTPGHLINVPADLPERVRAAARARIPRWYVAAEALLLGMDRTVWVEFRPTSDGRRYLVLDSRGDSVGSLLVPATTRVRQASATHIWVTETDADGLSSVARYRVSGLACTTRNC